eukprot:TRINITY_DN19178_c0_g1_i1.p1 TRINITY_DN19178_c0_g1~~TRINITY_DN19178_c0_g1_i1.p1  ORF type:complete len:371 (+),score=59.26 TRINITY_DN19178_c0_g1_i1:72-1184(+)
MSFTSDRPGFGFPSSSEYSSDSSDGHPPGNVTSDIQNAAIEIIENYKILKTEIEVMKRAIKGVTRERDALREAVLDGKQDLVGAREKIDGEVSNLESLLQSETLALETTVRERDEELKHAMDEQSRYQQERDALRSYLSTKVSQLNSTYEEVERITPEVQQKISDMANRLAELGVEKRSLAQDNLTAEAEFRVEKDMILEIEEEVLSLTQFSETRIVSMWEKVRQIEESRRVETAKYRSLVNRFESYMKTAGAVFNSSADLLRPQTSIFDRPLTTMPKATATDIGPLPFVDAVNEVFISRINPEEKLGCTWGNDDLTLKSVQSNSPAERSGMFQYIGKRLHSANGVSISSTAHLASTIQNATVINLRFFP